MMPNSMPMRLLIVCLALIMSALEGHSQQTFYVKPGATGSNNGSDWNNAYTALPSSMVRGAVYYLAAGNYGTRTFNTPNSGTNVITIRAATVASHGTDVGWSSGFAGQVVFTADCTVASDYWTFDGQTRGGYTNGYNLKFFNSTDGTGHNVYIDVGDSRMFTDIRFQFCEFEGTHGSFGLSDDGVYIYPRCNNFYMGSCYMHDFGGNPIMANYGGGSGTNYTFEYSYFVRNHQSYNSDHSECMSMTGSSLTIRYCIFQDIISSGYITDASGISAPISNWELYGNVFFWSSAYQNDPRAFIGNGIVGFFGETYSGHFYFYNNTIVGITNAATQISVYQGGLMLPGNSVQYQIENNIWYGCDTVGQYGSSGNTVDYNTYLRCKSVSATDTGAHKVVGSSNPFANLNALDFHLVGGSAAGVALASPYNSDLSGNARGADGLWDRGAYEFLGSAGTNPPVISGVQATTMSPTSEKVVWTTDKLASSLVRYGTTTLYGNLVSDATLSTSHSLLISNLNANTVYHYQVESADASNHVAVSGDFSFTTPPTDTIPPSVTITNPSNGATVSGKTTLAASASDNVGISGVQFLVDGRGVGSASSSPYSISWDSSSVTNGMHSLQAVATDTSGNTNVSVQVSLRAQNVVTNGLVGYWTFDEGFGSQASDSSGNGNTATLSGAGWGPALIGTAGLWLNGTNASAQVADSAALEISSDLSIALWVKHTALPATNGWMYYVEKGLDQSEDYAFGAYSDTNGTRLFLEFVDSTATYQYMTQTAGPTIKAGSWTHVGIVMNHANGSLNFYINGQLADTKGNTRTLRPTTNPLLIGQQNTAGYEFYTRGSMDEVRIYNRALAANELSSLQVLAKPLPPTGLVIIGQGP